jgi:eukaryotic-like serine/threonine-protein kinase
MGKMRPRTVVLLVAAGCAGSGPSGRPRAPRAESDAAAGDTYTTAPDIVEKPLPRDADSTTPKDAVTSDGGGSVDGSLDASQPDLPATAFENSLGMRFVRVPGTGVMFSIWETRVRDFEAYAMATRATIPHPEFPETPLQPKASVSRGEAELFARWLTTKEQTDKLLGPGERYRLPTDAEWDAAMQMGTTGGPFPWGSSFPPPDQFANYGVSQDGFQYTAPVGSFPPNRLGLYDLAGNLWEWIGEGCASGGAFLVRGAGWNAHNQPYLKTDFHYCFPADLVGHHNVGFRLVLSH